MPPNTTVSIAVRIRSYPTPPAAFCLFLCALLWSGCKLLSSTCDQNDPECLSRATGSGVNEPCERTIQCRSGLQCQQLRCQAVGETPSGERCSLTAECQSGLYCDHARTCASAGEGRPGDACENTADCTAGLGCGLGADLLSGACKIREQGDLGDDCSQAADCAAGLSCLPLRDQSICQSLPATDTEIPPLPAWQGVDCPAEPDDKRAHFEVPAAESDDPLPDFYRLPFPSDFWRDPETGRLDVSRHPRPPEGSDFTTANAYLKAIDNHVEGFSTTPVVFFRFSAAITNSRSDLIQAVRLVDVTPGAGTFGQEATIDVQTGEHSHYVCGEYLAVRVLPEYPLAENHTYAALVSRSLRADDDTQFESGSDFSKMLQNTPPKGAQLAVAYAAFAPLRDYLRAQEESADPWLTATVFTVGAPTAAMLRLRRALSERVPTIVPQTMERCAAGSDQANNIASDDPCPAPPAGVVMLRGELELPVFQEGDLPFTAAGSGELNPDLMQSAPVRFGLSLPNMPPPAEGYPVLIYAHGTRGSFASPFSPDGLGAALAQSGVRAATLAIDLPQHGERRGGSDEDPARLFFNITNPAAARGNVLQGAADLIALVNFITAGDFGPLEQHGQEVHFDSQRIAVMGHSQGATHVGLMLAHDPRVRAYVLSGMGGHLSTSLLHKELPLPVADLMGALLADMVTETLIPEPGLAAGAFNPLLALMQTYLDPADPINFARFIHLEPPAELTIKNHLFMTYGLSDHYTPEPAQTAYAVAAQLPHVRPHLSALALDGATAPATATIETDGIPRTIGMRQYEASHGVDGHFVAVRTGQAGRVDVERFLTVALDGSAPPIGD